MKDYEIPLQQLYLHGEWRRPYSSIGFLCDRQLRDHVTLPPDCRKIVLVFSNKRSFESTGFTSDRVRGTPKLTPLYYAFECVLARQYEAGRRYIRVEY